MSEAVVETRTLPKRTEVSEGDCWDLSSLYSSDEAWEADFKIFSSKVEGYSDFRGKLGEGPVRMLECLQFDLEIDRLAERLGTYAF
jgi:oligoendopeptidase F